CYTSTDTSEDIPKILALRKELEEIALKHLGKVSENTTTSTPSVNTGSESVNTGTPMPELEIFHKSEIGIFDEASYDEEGVITDFNSLPTEIEGRRYKRRKETKGKKVVSSLDFQEEVDTGSTKLSLANSNSYLRDILGKDYPLRYLRE
ncbi:hypothetical protein Tco_1552533, partial [Tanacetum coccineum]